ncbi:MAG: substrate-binding domain-containing protein [Candidatus Brocadiae bacterium]|nr:substrate-binding domain-containing protein [Candidatus Brocadiia bacterium]
MESGGAHDGRMSGGKLVLLGLAILMGFVGCKKQNPADSPPLLCYVGGTMRPAMEKLAAHYERETGVKVELDYGDSGSNLIRVRIQRRGDLYVAHDPFLAPLLNEGLGDRGWTLATLRAVIVVPKGNPKKITGLADLGKGGLRIVLTDPDYSTMGHICPVMFDRANLRERIEANVLSRMRMGGEVANAVALGRFDAGIVWDAVAYLRRDRLEAVTIEPAYRPHPDLDAVTSATFGPIDMSKIKVFIATLTCSEQPAAARKFAEFCASQGGKAVFSELGFSPAD